MFNWKPKKEAELPRVVIEGVSCDPLDHDCYRKQSDRLVALREQLAETRDRREEMARLLFEKRNAIANDAEAVLEGADIEDLPRGDIEAFHDFNRRERVLEEAIRMQEHRLRDGMHEASRAVAEQVRPHYEHILRKAVGLVEELGKLADMEAEFRFEVERRGLSFLLPVAALPEMRLSVSASRANRWLDQVRDGYGITVAGDRAGGVPAAGIHT